MVKRKIICDYYLEISSIYWSRGGNKKMVAVKNIDNVDKLVHAVVKLNKISKGRLCAKDSADPFERRSV